MIYNLVRMPSAKDELQKKLTEYTPFLASMYSKTDSELFGECNFILDHWLFLWDTGGGFVVEGHTEEGELALVALVTHYRDIWTAIPRLEIHRVAMAKELDANDTMLRLVNYLINNADLIKFKMIFYCSRDENGNELKELLWNNARGKNIFVNKFVKDLENALPLPPL